MKKNLWILEDEPDILEVTVFVGTRMGYQVCAANSVQSAWDMLLQAMANRQECTPKYVVSDFQLGDGDSLLWLMALLCVFPKVKVLCMSGSCTKEVTQKLELLRIYFLPKPSQLSDVIQFLTD